MVAKIIRPHRDLIANNLCSVCGFEMEEPARDFNICPSCGTEFGLHDVNASIFDLRAAWLSSGLKWWSTTDEKPSKWNPFEQLARLNATLGYALSMGPVFLMEATATNSFNQEEAAMRGASLAIAFAIRPAIRPLSIQLEAAS